MKKDKVVKKWLILFSIVMATAAISLTLLWYDWKLIVLFLMYMWAQNASNELKNY